MINKETKTNNTKEDKMAYRIKRTPNYYQGTLNAPSENYLTVADLRDNPQYDDYGLILEYETRKEAQAVIDDLEDGTYYLAHGEAGRPSYDIVDEDGDDQPDCLNASDEEIGGFEVVDPGDIPDDVLDELDNANVEYDWSDAIYDAYTYTAEDPNDDDRQYKIVFCPRHVAIQLTDGDLGNIDWDNQAYYREV